ncbi:MAG TPA: SLBB domain-containing protein [Gemmatimonadales bacterium]|nr:SLBB domain-containing protein [Gemmatimonadales bacterium]
MMRTLRTVLPLLAALAGASALAAQQRAEGFQAGDVIRLDVEGDTMFTGTFTVGPGPVLPLPEIGDIPLANVRRSDIEPYMQQQLGRYLRNRVVRAKALIRLSIVGEVERPGIYPVPIDLVLADAIMLAGGPTREAKFSATRIERGERRLVDGNRISQAIARGQTLDDLNLRAGDAIYVPAEARRDPESKWRIIGILVTLPAAIYGVIRLTGSN